MKNNTEVPPSSLNTLHYSLIRLKERKSNHWVNWLLELRISSTVLQIFCAKRNMLKKKSPIKDYRTDKAKR